MYKYLETFLRESTRALWESYKTNFRENYNGMLKLGANPYNFVNQISSLITGEDPCKTREIPISGIRAKL